MNSLSRFNRDGIELIIDTATGECFASMAGYARMANKALTTIHQRVRRYQQNSGEKLKTSKLDTSRGLRELRLLPEHLICAWLTKDNPDMALKLLKVGVRKYLHTMAGFEFNKQPVFDVPQTMSEALMLAAKQQEKIEQNRPKVEFAELVEASEGCLRMEAFAKSIGIGHKKIFRLLRKMHIIQRKPSTLPYQRYLNSGYFEVSETIKSNKPFAYCLITGKGQLWLTSLLKDSGHIK